jgi:hypothetical protein
LNQVKQGAVAQTALVKLAVPSLFNYVLCKVCPHEFDLLIRKFSPAGLDRLPSAIECGTHDANGVRIKYAALYVIVEELEHLLAPPPGMGRGYVAGILEAWRVKLQSPLPDCI